MGGLCKDRTENSYPSAHLLPFCSGLLAAFEPGHDKTNKMCVCPTKTQISLGICPIWSEFSLSARRKLGSLATHCTHSEDSDQTGRMPRLIWVFAGRTLILLVLSCRGSFDSAPVVIVRLSFISCSPENLIISLPLTFACLFTCNSVINSTDKCLWYLKSNCSSSS